MKTRSSNRIDPTHIPRPLPRKVKTRTFNTDDESVELPGVLDNFTAIDRGNCNPRFMSTTMHRVPPNKDVLKKCGIPFAVRFQPFADLHDGELSIPTVDFGEDGPLRCGRCRAYVNPYAKFLENGHKWRCNLCLIENEVPRGYQCSMDSYGRRRDYEDRPELSRGTVEFLVGKAMSGGTQREPLVVFAIDVSHKSIANGMLEAVAASIKSVLPHLPTPKRTRVGIFTFDSALHFYDMSSEDGPKMCIVTDANDPYAPLPPSSWIVNVADGMSRLVAVLNCLPRLYNKNTVRPSGENACGSAAQAAVDALSEIGGHACIFTSSTATVGSGKMKSREQQKSYGCDEEIAMYCAQPEDTFDFYHKLSTRALSKQVCVNWFVASSFHVDVANLGVLCRRTGGQLVYYQHFSGLFSADRERLNGDLSRLLTRGGGYEAVMKMRTSRGVEIPMGEYYGQFYHQTAGSDELYFAAVDADKEIAATLRHDGSSLTVGQSVYLQLAVLYTRRDGHRVIRVHNLSLKVTDHLPTIFRHACIGATCSYLTKRAVISILNKEPLSNVRNTIMTDAVEVLYKYRSNVASRSSSGQLILPESLKLIAVYMNSFFKSSAISVNSKGGRVRVRVDERAAALYRCLSFPASHLLGWLYPRLVQLHPLPDASYGTMDESTRVVKLPPPTWASAERVELDGVYMLHDCDRVMIHFGEHIPRETALALLGADVEKLMSEPKSLVWRTQDNEIFRRVSAIVEAIRRRWRTYGRVLPVYIMNGALKDAFAARLVEDRTHRTDTSYIDFLCALHKKIQIRRKG